ncbi:hypothetical protein C0993_002344 [Termitomyces sp. T159_Od127]|nr:hypothetical protein C0993_002344 [Termitomyces sp. T159_Od127]
MLLALVVNLYGSDGSSKVREMFHMDHFINMVGFNPKEAKTDNSKVFQNYKTSLYNLVDKAAPSSSRSTRRTRTEHEQLLKAPPSLALLSPSVSISPSIQRQPKARAGTSTNTAPALEAAKSSGPKAKAKAKAKGWIVERSSEPVNASVFDDDPPPREESISAIILERHPHHDDQLTSRPTKKRKMTCYDSTTIENRRSGRFKEHDEKVAVVPDNSVEVVVSSVIGPSAC